MNGLHLKCWGISTSHVNYSWSSIIRVMIPKATVFPNALRNALPRALQFVYSSTQTGSSKSNWSERARNVRSSSLLFRCKCWWKKSSFVIIYLNHCTLLWGKTARCLLRHLAGLWIKYWNYFNNSCSLLCMVYVEFQLQIWLKRSESNCKLIENNAMEQKWKL